MKYTDSAEYEWCSAKSLLRVNPISLSYPFPLPLPLSFARSRESKGCPNSHFDRGVGLRARGRYPLKPSIFASLLETKGYPEHTAQPATMSARSSRESIFGLNNWFKNYDSLVLCSTQSCTYIFATMFLIERFKKIASLLRFTSLICTTIAKTSLIKPTQSTYTHLQTHLGSLWSTLVDSGDVAAS